MALNTTGIGVPMQHVEHVANYILQHVHEEECIWDFWKK